MILYLAECISYFLIQRGLLFMFYQRNRFISYPFIYNKIIVLYIYRFIIVYISPNQYLIMKNSLKRSLTLCPAMYIIIILYSIHSPNSSQNLPLLPNCSAVINCSPYDVHSIGDHHVWYGHVQEVTHSNQDEPLLYYARYQTEEVAHTHHLHIIVEFNRISQVLTQHIEQFNLLTQHLIYILVMHR